MKAFRRIAATAAVLAFAGTPLLAQSTATVNINASAFIAGQAPIAVSLNQNLQWGTAGTPVNAGAGPTQASASGGSSGRVTVTGEPGMAFTVDFVLPTTLVFGANSIAVTFGASDGIEFDDGGGTVLSTFDPGVTFNTSLVALAGANPGTREIGLDGSIDPPLGTVSGNYTGTVVVNVAY